MKLINQDKKKNDVFRNINDSLPLPSPSSEEVKKTFDNWKGEQKQDYRKPTASTS